MRRVRKKLMYTNDCRVERADDSHGEHSYPLVQTGH